MSDYHLRGGETGTGVVAAVRDKLGWIVPAIFVTGDTARSAITNARVEKAMLLNKPVRADDLLDAVRERDRRTSRSAALTASASAGSASCRSPFHAGAASS